VGPCSCRVRAFLKYVFELRCYSHAIAPVEAKAICRLLGTYYVP
jgi:hypothetical protein